MANIVSNLLKNVEIPRMFKVKQNFPTEHIKAEDIHNAVMTSLNSKRALNEIVPGTNIAITAGSRGIANIGVILRTLVAAVKGRGATPYLVAAMGSHGGATSEGQRAVLEGYGITEESMGCSIKTDMDVVEIGVNAEGKRVYIGKNAAEADGIILCNRIKPHTCFRGPYESGLVKMMAIGLAKQAGAEACHKEGFGKMAKNIQLFGKTVLEKTPILFGVAVLENAYDETAKIVTLHKNEIICEEPKLLKEALALLPRIYVPECDVLICDKIGKNYSGSGMDANITGTFVTPYASGGLKSQRVAVLDLSNESHGNGTGCGMAHATTRRFFEKMDFEQTYPNLLTSTVIENARIPMVFKNDKEAIQACIHTCTNIGEQGVRIVRIANSMEIEHILLSENYYEEVEKCPGLEIETEPSEMLFDGKGNLVSLGKI